MDILLFSLPCFLAMYVGIYASGLVDTKDTITIISSKVFGFSSRRYFLIPEDSNWNTPVVSPSAKTLNTFLFSKLSFRRSTSILWFCRIILRHRFIMVRFRSPRVHLQKSEFFNWVLRKLCYGRLNIFWGMLERTIVGNRFWRDNNRTGMNSS